MDSNKYEIIGISKHPDPFDTTLLAAKIRWFRWLETDKGQEWKTWWDMPKCLTCNKPQIMLPLVSDGKGFLVVPEFYGRWNYCYCPKKWIDQDFYLANKGEPRRPTMKWTVNAELILQESDAKAKTEMVAAFMNFEVTADSFDDALKIAKELLEGKTDGANITGIGLAIGE